ncbi:hypothetical protein L1D61_25620 [Vibrio mediterranei]|uniref:Uncharacterized protein n=1 Tax=Vibrio mediterranei TaxID=689 RepID=A0A3G4VJS2_9VIBR|nr:hypothetical protein [Vibrio mediterranei]AYV25056.1 hypothetical protein ECB94_27520 [Vibrio mediterranei]MCG9790524.1 hypothetical protein [Vibrio mediterranei]
MTRVEIINPSCLVGMSEIQSDLELPSEHNQVLGKSSLGGQNGIVNEQDIVDMMITQGVINETVRRMKSDQKRLEEIINEV